MRRILHKLRDHTWPGGAPAAHANFSSLISQALKWAHCGRSAGIPMSSTISGPALAFAFVGRQDIDDPLRWPRGLAIIDVFYGRDRPGNGLQTLDG
ncbi:MAG: hypothetical protein ACR2M4_01560 [Actinomycetota bacterium]